MRSGSDGSSDVESDGGSHGSGGRGPEVGQPQLRTPTILQRALRAWRASADDAKADAVSRRLMDKTADVHRHAAVALMSLTKWRLEAGRHQGNVVAAQGGTRFDGAPHRAVAVRVHAAMRRWQLAAAARRGELDVVEAECF